MKVVQEQVEPPSARAQRRGLPEVDSVMEKICLKALAKSPEDRPEKAYMFAANLAMIQACDKFEPM